MSNFNSVVLLWVVLCYVINSGGANDTFTNIMKIVQGSGVHHPHFQNNTDQGQKNNTAEDIDDLFIVRDVQIVANALRKLNSAGKCRRDALIVLEAIARRERWSVQMFDSSAKFPVGALYGNHYQLGNFDECVNILQQVDDPTEVPIAGKYCLADVDLYKRQQSEGRVARSFESVKSRETFDRTLHWAICVPSSCSTPEIKIIVQEIFTYVTDLNTVSVDLNEKNCHVIAPQQIGALEIVFGCSIGIFSIFVIFATSFHYYVLQETKQKHSEAGGGTVKDVLLCFSVIATVEKFLATKSSKLNLECICGIRFISMLLIIAGHTFFFTLGGPVMNTDFHEKESANPLNAVFINGPILVDTFLLISGFLMCYLLLLELDKRRGKINMLVLYIVRYIRLTPSYLVVIALYCTVLLRAGDGPLWNARAGKEYERCRISWWTNLLYVNNYVSTDNLCMFQSWYLATDYHLFIIAPLVIYPLWKWPKWGKILLSASILTSIIIPFVITFSQKLDPTFLVFAPEAADFNNNYYFTTAYIKTHMRSGGYFMGIFFGYILYKIQTQGIKLQRYVVWFGWLLAATCGLTSMYSVVIFYDPHHQYNAFEAAIYSALHRVAWCISIGWVLIACITNNASLVNGFLSWKPFIPLSRLTYCAYLCNGLVELYSAGVLRNEVYMSILEMGTKAIAHAIITFFSAFVLCILFESPICGLEKLMLKRDKPKVDKNTAVQIGNASPA